MKKRIWNWIYLHTGIGFLLSVWEVHSGKVIVDEITYPTRSVDRPAHQAPHTERKWRFL